MEEIKLFIKKLVAKSFFLTKIINPGDISTPIIRAIQGKENPTEFKVNNPQDITRPLIYPIEKGFETIEKAIQDKEGIREVSVKNLSEIKPDFSELVKTFKEEIKKLDKEVVVKNDLGQLLGLFKTNSDKKDLIKALEKIESKIPVLKQQEVIDYALLISEAITKIESLKLDIDLKPLQEEIQKLGDIIKEGKSYKGQIIGRGGGYSSVGIKNASEARVNPATEEKQDEIKTKLDTLNSNVATDTKLDEMITAVKGISGRYLPTYDTKEIDEADANNVVITYKLNSATVATETIAISGTTTTISLTLA